MSRQREALCLGPWAIVSALLLGCAGTGASKGADWGGLPRGARAAADSIVATMARETGMVPRRSRGEVNPIYLNCERPAARLEIRWQSDRASFPDPFTILERELPRMGWALDERSRADGPDGTVYAFTRGGLLCVVEGRWDGGDAADSTQVLDPTKSLLVDVASGRPCPKRDVND